MDDFNYSYNPFDDNYNGLSLANFNDEFRYSPPYTETFTKFKGYYGKADYDTEWMRSAFDGDSQMGFAEDLGVMDFSNLGLEGRGAAIRWGVPVLSVWAFVMNAVEEAAHSTKCESLSVREETLYRWHQAVSAYTGSLPIDFGDDSGGYFLYSLVQTECGNFGTCKEGATGLATVNEKIFESFRQGKLNLIQRECENARGTVERIRELMTIPLIQGIIRSMYALDIQDNSQETIQGQAAAYAAAILPLVHDCSVGNAFVIYDDLAPGKAVGGSFEVVKAALERTYDCLGVTCEDIGGLLNLRGDGYLKGAEPCGIGPPTFAPTTTLAPTTTFAPTFAPTAPVFVNNKSSTSTGSNSSTSTRNSQQSLAIGLSVGAGVIAALIAIFVGVLDYRRNKQYDTAEDTPPAPSVVETDCTDDAPGNEEEIPATPQIV